MSYGSHRVLDLLGDVVKLQPDVVIVWSGNNEFVERNAYSSYARGKVIGPLQRWLQHSSLFRTVRIGLEKTVPGWFAGPQGEDITDLRKSPRVSRGNLGHAAGMDRQVLENYRSNLEAMAGLIESSGAAMVFCTVPVNLAEWVPDQQLPVLTDPAAQKQWLEQRDQALQLGAQGQYEASAQAFARLLTLTPDYAYGHYLRGVALSAAGDFAEAAGELSRARDLDARPIRALSTFEATIREVARNHGGYLADLEQAFARQSGKRLVGLDLFLDYVHPNQAGTKLAAITILEAMQPALGDDLSVPQLARSIAADDWVDDQPNNRADRAYVLGMTLFNNGDLAGAEQAYLQALAIDPDYPEPAGNLGVIYERQGDLVKAASYFRRAVARDPKTVHSVNLARVLFRQGDRQGAREAGEKALQAGYVDVDLYLLMGDIELADRHYQQALAYFQQAQGAGAAEAVLHDRLDEVKRKLAGLPAAARPSGAPTQ